MTTKILFEASLQTLAENKFDNIENIIRTDEICILLIYNYLKNNETTEFIKKQVYDILFEYAKNLKAVQMLYNIVRREDDGLCEIRQLTIEQFLKGEFIHESLEYCSYGTVFLIENLEYESDNDELRAQVMLKLRELLQMLDVNN